jgi:hypothetical protein
MTLHPAQFAGRYYFPDAGRLRASVESFIEDASVPRPSGRLLGLVVPHAQLSEFGAIAGHAYKLLLSVPLSWDTIVMLAPTTQQSDRLLCDPSDSYDTPLDPLPIDTALRARLIARGTPINLITDDEPVIECHAPFVLSALGAVNVLPLRVPATAMDDVRDYATLTEDAAFTIICANLPESHEAAACDAISRMDAGFFDGMGVGVGAQAKRGLFSRKVAKPAITPDVATIGLGLRILRLRGATRGIVLRRAGAYVAIAIVRGEVS